MGNPADTMQLLETFTRIADAGSLSAAARGLGTSQASVSRQLAALESRLKTALARRSTHELTLTEEGGRLLPRALEILAAWEATRESLAESEAPLQGRLRVIAPSGIGPSIVAQAAALFVQRHPQVDIDLTFTDASVDVVGIGADLQIKVGPVERQELIVRRIGVVERWLVAAAGLDLSAWKASGDEARDGLPVVALAPLYDGVIPFTDHHGTARSLNCRVRLRCEVLNAAYQAVLAGGGVGLMPRWLVAEDVAAGRLRRLLRKAAFASVPIHLAFPPGRYRPRRTREFADMIENEIGHIGAIR